MEKADQVRLNHELLIWVGFTLTNGVWSYPDGVTVDNGVPYFPESLDACFKWLVPKMLKGDYPHLTEIIFDPTMCEIEMYTYYLRYDSLHDDGCVEREESQGYAQEPALAFCLAIQKLIRSERK